MKFIPKTKLGAVIAVLYLLFVGALIAGGGSWNGSHGDPSGLLIWFAVILTLPSCLIGFGIMSFIDTSPAVQTSGEWTAMILSLVVGAIVNTVLIYLLVGFAIQLLRKLFKKPLK